LNDLIEESKRGMKLEFVPSRTILIKFAGQCLPHSVSFLHVRFPVLPYIPRVRLYFSCLRYGATTTLLRKRRRDRSGPPHTTGELPPERPLDPGISFFPWKLVPLRFPRESTLIRDPRRRPSTTIGTQTSVWPPLPSAPLPPPEELEEFKVGPPLSPLPLTPVKPRTPGRRKRKRKRINPRLS
ncbi:hypothetical protein ALC60_01393, partial [Trachymyrmex zeteki]